MTASSGARWAPRTGRFSRPAAIPTSSPRSGGALSSAMCWVRETSVFIIGPRLRGLLRQLGARRFDDLDVPFSVIATDLATGNAVALDRGPLEPALTASFALPGLLPPSTSTDAASSMAASRRTCPSTRPYGAAGRRSGPCAAPAVPARIIGSTRSRRSWPRRSGSRWIARGRSAKPRRRTCGPEVL